MNKEQENQLNRELLVKNLEALSKSSEKLVAETAVNALKLLDDYDNVLRGLACSLSAGGYNSDGLIDPKVAGDKIHWGIDYLVKTTQKLPVFVSK